jgi:hypothetical protein
MIYYYILGNLVEILISCRRLSCHQGVDKENGQVSPTSLL